MNEITEVEIVEIEEYALVGKPIPKAAKYVVRIDETRVAFTNPNPTGIDLLTAVNKKPCAYVVVQIIRNADDQFIDPNEHVDLRSPGVERFATVAKDIVQVYIDGQKVDVARGIVPVSQIKNLGGIADGYQLAQDVDGRLVPLASDASIDIQGCEVFESRPPAGGAS